MTPRLPQELLDEIVDWLHDDPKPLAAVSSAASCFRARAQAKIFHEIKFCLRTHSPTSFLPFLTDSPHILPLVRSLRLVATEFPPTQKPGACGPTRVYLHDDEAFSQVIESLHNVHRVVLTDMIKLDPFMKPHGLLKILSSLEITSLTLDMAFLESPHAVFAIISHFPFVVSLRLLEVHTILSALPPVIPNGVVPIQELSFTAGLASSPLGTFTFHNLQSGWLKRLKTLNIQSYFVNELPIIARLIERLPDLTKLFLGDPVGEISHPSSKQTFMVHRVAFV